VDSEEVSTAKGKFRFSGFTLLCLGGPVGLFIVLFFIYQFILGSVGETILK